MVCPRAFEPLSPQNFNLGNCGLVWPDAGEALVHRRCRCSFGDGHIVVRAIGTLIAEGTNFPITSSLAFATLTTCTNRPPLSVTAREHDNYTAPIRLILGAQALNTFSCQPCMLGFVDY